MNPVGIADGYSRKDLAGSCIFIDHCGLGVILEVVKHGSVHAVHSEGQPKQEQGYPKVFGCSGVSVSSVCETLKPCVVKLISFHF